MPNGAVHVGDRAARPADEMVMVVADPCLVASHGSGRLDAPHEAGGRERAKDVVDGLVGHLAEIRTHDIDDRFRVGVRMLMNRGEDRDPRTSYAK